MRDRTPTAPSTESPSGVAATLALLLAGVLCALPAAAQNIQTFAGTGATGLSTDPGPALTATMTAPRGVAYSDALERLYFADPDTNTLRAINLATSTTLRVVGNGLAGTSTMGIPATLSALGDPVAVALSAAGTVYLLESFPGKLTRLNGTVLALVAGNGLAGGGGDGGLATAASLDNPIDVGIDAAGNLYVLERNRHRVRRIDAGTGIIQTVVGNGFPGFSGDGGPASAAQLAAPEGLHVTPAGDLYIADTVNARVRVVDAVTGWIDTLAGGGVTTGDAALLDVNLATVHDVTIGPFGYAIASRDGIAYELDTDAGTAFVVAGTGVLGFSGDGGDATLAQIGGPRGLAADAATSTLFLADTTNRRLRRIAMLPRTVVLTGSEPPATLASLTEITQDLVIDATSFESLSFPNLVMVGDSISVDSNPALETVEFDALADVGGSLVVSDNPLLQSVAAPALEEVGDMSVTDNATLRSFELSALESAGDMTFARNPLESLSLSALVTAGDVTVEDLESLFELDLSVLFSAGDVTLADVDALAEIDLAQLTLLGAFTVTDNETLEIVALPSLQSVEALTFGLLPSLTTLDLSSLANAGEIVVADLDALLDLDLSALVNADTISLTKLEKVLALDLSALVSAGDLTAQNLNSLVNASFPSLEETYSVSVTDNELLAGVDLSVLASGGTITVASNPSLDSLDLSALSEATSLSITGNPELGTIDISALTEVAGDVTIETESVPELDLSDVAVGGDLTVEGTNMETVSVQTAALDTSIALLHPGAAVQVQLPFGTFVVPATLTVTRQEPSGLVSESGSDGDGGAASVDPIAAYQFAFSIPTPFGVPATLSFIAYLADLSEEEQTELVAGIAAGTASLAVKSDVAGSEYETLALCTGAQTPAADGCVAAERLDAAGLPLAPESTEIPAAIRFTSVAGHFSTWALVHTERALAAALVATIDEPITLSNPKPVAVVVHGSAALDVSLVGVASLRFGVGQVAALSTTIVPGGDPYPDLIASFPVAGSGVALGDSEACVSGLVGGEAFVACDGVLVRLHGRRCGLGFELALAVPLLTRLRRRRR